MKKAWDEKRRLLGIYIHRLLCSMNGGVGLRTLPPPPLKLLMECTDYPHSIRHRLILSLGTLTQRRFIRGFQIVSNRGQHRARLALSG
ncbi:hypothetical protein H3V08_03490 [Bifidobacterium sp. M0307]|nr:hypothetical protein [Bifidobacterium sp. M0307]